MELDARKPEGDILSQEEIARLLEQVADEDTQVLIHKTDGSKEKRPKDTLRPYDFRAPAFLSASQWRKLRLEHEDFASSLGGQLSNHLRLEVALQLSKLETRPFRDFATSLPEPTHLALFKLEPLRGICLFNMPPHLGLTIVDRLMGGAGYASSTSRDLSEIEVALLDQALLMVLNEWCQRWAKFQDLHPTILGHETSGHYLQTATADTPMLILALQARIGHCVEEFTLAFPCTTLEPLIRQVAPALEPTETAPPPPPASKPKWNPEFNTIAVPLVAAWPERQLSARQLAQLKVGDILDWDPAVVNQVRLRLTQTAKFVGRLGSKNGKWAVEITGSLPSQAA